MAHKKGGGSTRNGRDSIGKRLGVKRFSGNYVTAGEHSHPTAWERTSTPETMLGSEETIRSSRKLMDMCGLSEKTNIAGR